METNYLSGGTHYRNLLTMMETTDMMSPSIISLLGLASASVSQVWILDGPSVRPDWRTAASSSYGPAPQPSHTPGSLRGRAASYPTGNHRRRPVTQSQFNFIACCGQKRPVRREGFYPEHQEWCSPCQRRLYLCNCDYKSHEVLVANGALLLTSSHFKHE